MFGRLFIPPIYTFKTLYINGLVQDCSNFIANALGFSAILH